MRKAILAAAILFLTLPAVADKIKGETTLKDSQPYGTKDKQHKHQAYDLSFVGQGKSYTCRTDSGKSMNATDFVVGSAINYEINDNKAKLKTPQNKKVEYKIVRVEQMPGTP
jgi:gentisate 1,2-dioxygenase